MIVLGHSTFFIAAVIWIFISIIAKLLTQLITNSDSVSTDRLTFWRLSFTFPTFRNCTVT